jgi:hypothetical protein
MLFGDAHVILNLWLSFCRNFHRMFVVYLASCAKKLLFSRHWAMLRPVHHGIAVLFRNRRSSCGQMSPESAAGSEPDWVGGQGSAYLAYSVRAEDGRAIYVGFSNAGGVEAATIPAPPAGTSWHRVVDTGVLLPAMHSSPFCIHAVSGLRLFVRTLIKLDDTKLSDRLSFERLEDDVRRPAACDPMVAGTVALQGSFRRRMRSLAPAICSRTARTGCKPRAQLCSRANHKR